MPWYRIFADHGNGHQSHTDIYRWFEKPLATKQEREDAWMECFDDGRLNWPIGDVELVDRLPQHIYDEKVKAAWASIEHSHKMLEILTKTETKPVIAVRFEVKPPAKPGDKPVTGYQARTLPPSNISGLVKPTRRGALRSLISKLHITANGKSRRARQSDYAVVTR